MKSMWESSSTGAFEAGLRNGISSRKAAEHFLCLIL